MISKTVSSSRFQTSSVMTPQDANVYGKVFGGMVFSMMDYCAYAAASRYAGVPCVTAAVDSFSFLTPIEVGELVICEASVVFVGRSSLDVRAEVFAENVFTSERRPSNVGHFVMVAKRDGEAYVVPRLVCETTDDMRRFLEAQNRRKLRAKRNDEHDDILDELREASDDEIRQKYADSTSSM